MKQIKFNSNDEQRFLKILINKEDKDFLVTKNNLELRSSTMEEDPRYIKKDSYFNDYYDASFFYTIKNEIVILLNFTNLMDFNSYIEVPKGTVIYEFQGSKEEFKNYVFSIFNLESRKYKIIKKAEMFYGMIVIN